MTIGIGLAPLGTWPPCRRGDLRVAHRLAVGDLVRHPEHIDAEAPNQAAVELECEVVPAALEVLVELTALGVERGWGFEDAG
jgi:hypothetical protein